MRIGPYLLKNPWILAPMAGVSEMPYRVIAREMGASAAPTELVSAKGLLFGQERTRRYLTRADSETPFWVQLFGGDPETMARGAAAAVEQGADIIDINMGCPVKKVTRTGAGSALLCDPARGAAMVEGIIARTGLPVTVKIRSGWDDDSRNYVELAKALGAAGASAIAMHARTREQGYRGEANWAHIKELVVNSPIPVIGNGDVWSASDARRMVQETGCAGVMIGRGALGNPWIFEELTLPTAGGALGHERWKMVERHFNAHLEFLGEELRAVRRFRPFFQWYSHGLRAADSFCHKINRIDDVGEVLGEARAFFCGAEIEDCDRRTAFYDTKKALG